MYRLTAAESDARGRAVAARLAASGVSAGQRVALAVPEAAVGDLTRADAAALQAALLVAALGAMRAGVVPVVINPALPPEARLRQLADCDPAARLSTPAEVFALSDPAGAPSGPELPAWPQTRPMHYTSGTTGPAKGVWTGMLAAPAGEAWWRDEADQWPHEPDDVTLIHGPVAHFGPLRFAIMALLSGGTALVPDRFDAAATAEALHRDRPTTAFVVPSHLQRLFALPGGQPPSTYRRLIHAGAACPEPLKRRTHAWAGTDRVWEFYGSTEGQFTACPGREWEARPGTVGRARRGRTITIDDGTIWCAGPEYCRFEYFRDPAKTARAWRVSPTSAAFTVGDLGRLDGDGYLFIEGRREDLIVTGGVNVYPAEVEPIIRAIPGVEDVAVFGVDDAHWGQRVCAAYIGPATPASVAAGCRERLAKHQVPKSIYDVERLPLTATGKVKRRSLIDLARDRG